MTRLDDIRRFYSLLGDLERHLGCTRKLEDSDGWMNWPKRGVYFFFELGEHQSESGSGPRVVRVGTHALKAGSRTALWNRLAQHRGTVRSGGGNHRGSIFRLIVGSALIRREGWDCPSWGVASHPRQAASRLGIAQDELLSMELPIERSVSQYIRAMPFLWLALDDAPGPGSQRRFIEKNTIGLLSNFSRPVVDAASGGWLGRYSDRDLVRQSGLWNNNHVQDGYDTCFLENLERIIAESDRRS